MIDKIRIAENAIEKAMEEATFFLNDPEVLSSDFKDIKTMADLKMNEAIQRVLEPSGVSILSEETDFAEKVLPDECWIVDPLDGTFNFSRKYPCAGISIGYVENGDPVVGVVRDIFNNATYSAGAGQGATKNGKKIEVSKVAHLKDSILATGFPSGASYETDDLLSFVRKVQEFKKIRAIGSASMMLCYVAEGIFDVYYEKDIYLWDVIAGLLLVKEAGGDFLMKRTGNTFKFEVLASNRILFEKAKSLLIE